MKKLENCIRFKDHLEEMKREDPSFAKEYEEGYQEFKLGLLLKKERESAHLTQEQVAQRVHSTKSSISRLESHAKDVKISTLFKYAQALGKKVEIHFV